LLLLGDSCGGGGCSGCHDGMMVMRVMMLRLWLRLELWWW
jgi:hypothetical protein